MRLYVATPSRMSFDSSKQIPNYSPHSKVKISTTKRSRFFRLFKNANRRGRIPLTPKNAKVIPFQFTKRTLPATQAQTRTKTPIAPSATRRI